MPIAASPTPLQPRRRRALGWAAVSLGLLPTLGVRAAPATPATGPAPAPAASPPVPGPLVRMPDGRLLAPDVAALVMRGELRVAMLAVDTPPFFHLSQHELVGLEVDMAKDLARELKVPVRFVREARNFNGVVDLVARGEADVGISKLSRTLARAQVIRFSAPYLRLNHALVLNRLAFARLARDKAVGEVVRQFNGTIGVIANSSFADYAKRHFPQAQLRPYPGWEQVVAAVRSGEVVGAYRDEFEVKRLLRSDPTASLTLRTITLKDLEDTLGIAVGADAPLLHQFVDLFLAQRNDKLDVDKVLRAVGV
ncbi:amino acid ABC transporter substrate-binding protein [Ideonella sp. TBM-1]|uniref:Amino acid ABC transporter substrate-binding protein n=2 Tax=Ideonella livida TaxID=2707176 RepID=A0A7C9TIX0_9BURK|nr:amino acid ABC transporter substrate-binding protein [Ideonella livida]